MTTADVIGPQKTKSKPYRSMTHPRRADGKRLDRNDTFDPDELVRRLEAYRIEQKQDALRRRARATAGLTDAKTALAAKPGEGRTEPKIGLAQTGPYHHVPKMAAADFARTATPGLGDASKGQVHALARDALKQHVEGLRMDQTAHASHNLRHTLAIDQAKARRESLRERNQFQLTHDLEEAAILDRERDVHRLPQRTWAASRHSVSARLPEDQRRFSIGAEVFWEEGLSSSMLANPQALKTRQPCALAANDRHDWAQRDESLSEGHRSVKEFVVPLLRKSESVWIAKTKKESSIKEDCPMTSPDEVVQVKQERSSFPMAMTNPDAVTQAKHKRSSFFNRFRRVSRGAE